MTLSFTHEPLPGRVVFGAGSLDSLPAEAARLGARKVLVLSTPGQRALAEKARRCWAMPSPASTTRP
jgi:maleylacetate reductase